MADRVRILTTLSTKGQLMLPKSIRQKRAWGAGTRLAIEETEEGISVTAAPAFRVTRPEEVFGCLKTDRPAITIEEMDAAVLAEARRRHACD